MVFLPEKRRKSRFFRIRKEEPEEEETEEEAPEEEAGKEASEEIEEETAEKLVKGALEEEEAGAPEAKEKPAEAERLPPSIPTPREPETLRRVKEDIYRLKGALKTLEKKLDRKEISPEEYAEKSKKLNLMLANLQEKKIKHELGIR